MTRGEMVTERAWHRPDQIVENCYGNRAWLKPTEDMEFLTDCCLASAPCAYHARLTHQAAPLTQ
jgi:hypothetical protein